MHPYLVTGDNSLSSLTTIKMSRFAAKHVPQLGFAKATQPDFSLGTNLPSLHLRSLLLGVYDFRNSSRCRWWRNGSLQMAAHCLRGMKWKSPGNMSGDCEEQVNGSQSLIVLPAKKTLNKKKWWSYLVSYHIHVISFHVILHHRISFDKYISVFVRLHGLCWWYHVIL